MELQKIPVIFDTDIGSDIDDAVCLSYLLNEPRCELLGVTTVSGEPEKRAAMASALCIAAGKPEIPIYSGAAMPILGLSKQPKAPQAEALVRWPHKADFKSDQAVLWMRDTIRNNPGQITLLAVGPMTNLGLLFRLDPEIPSLLKSLVLMCGAFTNRMRWDAPMGMAEWNAMNDPIATSIVYEAKVDRHISIGLDVTTHCTMKADEARAKLVGPVLGIVKDFAEVWFRHTDVITFHDPLAGVVIFEEDTCTYEHGRIEVELQSQRSAGLTYWDAGSKEKPHTIAKTVDSDKFFQRYFGVF